MTGGCNRFEVTTSQPSYESLPTRPQSIPTFYDPMAMDLVSVLLDSPVASRVLFLLWVLSVAFYISSVYLSVLFFFDWSDRHPSYASLSLYLSCFLFSFLCLCLFSSMLFYSRLLYVLQPLRLYLHTYRPAFWDAFMVKDVLTLLKVY